MTKTITEMFHEKYPKYFQDKKVLDNEVSSDEEHTPIVTKKRTRENSDIPIIENVYKLIRLAKDEINHLENTLETIEALINDEMDVDVINLVDNYIKLKAKLLAQD